MAAMASVRDEARPAVDLLLLFMEVLKGRESGVSLAGQPPAVKTGLAAALR
jgi:hypothetical protein